MNLDNLSERKPADELLWRDVRSVLDEEIDLLPEKYRSAIVLCYLQGHTTEEVAELLGCPERTVQRHLMRGREQLKCRLTQRGLTLSAGLLAMHLSMKAVSAAVPAVLSDATVKAASQFIAGRAPTGHVSASVMALADEALCSLCVNKIRNLAVIIFAVVALGMGVRLAADWGLSEFGRNQRTGTRLVLDEPLRQPSFLRSVSEQSASLKDLPKRFTNSLGMSFVWIPPGAFVMGSPQEESRRRIDELQHQVTLTKGFYMGVYTVTQEEWLDLMGYNPAAHKGEKTLPVENVSWQECQVFIQKLCEIDKKAYRLPTEAEWEYACRAGTVTPFHWGEILSTKQANYLDTSPYGSDHKGIGTTLVGSFLANAWGLHDMHGNVRQWCQDWYDAYSQQSVADPQGLDGKWLQVALIWPGKMISPVRLPQVKDPEAARVTRGGSWSEAADNCRSACRHRDDPTQHSDVIGFRLCFSPD